MALRFMSIATKFGKSDPSILTGFSMHALIELAMPSTPPEVQAEVERRIAAGEIQLPGWKTVGPRRIFGKMNNSVAIAVVAGAIIVAATMAVVFRYEVTPVSTTVAHRFDRWTGTIQICAYQKARMECSDDKPPQTP